MTQPRASTYPFSMRFTPEDRARLPPGMRGLAKRLRWTELDRATPAPHSDSIIYMAEKWCGRPESNRHGGTPNGFSYPLRLSPPPERAFVVWTIPSPWPRRERRMALGAARLVSTPSPCGAWLGIASEGFPDFEQFYVPGFPGRTQILAFKSGASTSFATPAYRRRL